jgi:hypothetical protein
MNIGFILRLLLPEVLQLLQMTIKNPQSVASEMTILQAVYDALGTIIAANKPQ